MPVAYIMIYPYITAHIKYIRRLMTADIINEKLAQFLRDGQKWEKKDTNVQGVLLLKLPTFKQSPSSIAIDINPINTNTGLGTKKRGIIIRSSSELEQFNQLLSNPKVIQLAKKIEAVNPENKEDTNKRNSTTDIFEI
jgi:hypothetical protein